MSGDSFIHQLADNLSAETRPLMHPVKRLILWAVITVFYLCGCIIFLGARFDLTNKFSDTSFLFEVGLMGAVALTAGLGSLFLCVPDMRGKGWLRALAPTLCAVFVFWEMMRSMTEGVHLQTLHWDHCFSDALLMGTVPMVLLMFFTMRGATIYPLTQGLFNAVAVGAVGYVGLRITCAMDTVGHTCIYHLIPFIFAGFIIGVLAKKIFRW